MERHVDKLARALALTASRREALRALLQGILGWVSLSALIPTAAAACKESGTSPGDCNANQIDCIDYCCSSATSDQCWFEEEKCCPTGFGFCCSSTNLCYSTFTAAQNACGNAYDICGAPVD